MAPALDQAVRVNQEETRATRVIDIESYFTIKTTIQAYLLSTIHYVYTFYRCIEFLALACQQIVITHFLL